MAKWSNIWLNNSLDGMVDDSGALYFEWVEINRWVLQPDG